MVRYDPKDFRQRQPDGKGGWVWKMAGVQLVPFHLPELRVAVAAGRTIYVAEGEKGVLSLQGLGMVATCFPGGAGKWRQAYAPHFVGAEMVILPDADQPGEQHALQVARALKDVAASVRMLPLPGISTKGDIADWIAAGGTAEALLNLAANAEPYEASTRERPQETNRAGDNLDLTEDGVARLFEEQHHDMFRFCEDTGQWHQWSGQHWGVAMRGAAFTWAPPTGTRCAA